MKRRIGYSDAVRLIDTLRDDVARLLPAARGLRTDRASVEFTFGCENVAAAEALLHDLCERLGDPATPVGHGRPRTVTIAAAPCRDGIVSEAVVAQVEALLQQALRDGVPVQVAPTSADDSDDAALLRDLRRAVDGDGLTLHYQPKLRARSTEMAGTEALLRWTHPVHGPISPELFIPLAERSGDIEAITRWVLARALADQEALAAAGLSIPTHVNISAPLLARSDFVAGLLAELAGHEQRIGFEITETAMIVDPEGTLARLHEIAGAGVRLAIDDYGSGFSSLAYLRRLPVHEIKIDRTFISRLATSPRDPLLVRSTINLAHALEMEVTAEGVETAAALALLQVMGCDMVQGFFLSKPLPLDGLIAFARAVEAGAALPRPVSLRERTAQRRQRREDER